MLVFHIQEGTRAFRGRSSSVVLPPSRRRAAKRGTRAAIPANAVVNAPPEPAADGHEWIASAIDRSEPNFPRAIWRQVPRAAPPREPVSSSQAPQSPPVSVETMAVLALMLLLARGKAKALARGEALALLRRWVTLQGGDGNGRLNAEIEALLKEGIDAQVPDRRTLP